MARSIRVTRRAAGRVGAGSQVLRASGGARPPTAPLARPAWCVQPTRWRGLGWPEALRVGRCGLGMKRRTGSSWVPQRAQASGSQDAAAVPAGRPTLTGGYEAACPGHTPRRATTPGRRAASRDARALGCARPPRGNKESTLLSRLTGWPCCRRARGCCPAARPPCTVKSTYSNGAVQGGIIL